MISVLLPTKTRIDLFPASYGSLLYQMQDCPEEYEVIIVNDNTFQEDEIGRQLGLLGVNYIYGPATGSAMAFKAAADAAQGDKLLFINDDIVFYQPFIKPLLERYDEGYKIIGSRLVYENMTIQHAGMEFLPDHGWTSAHKFRGYPFDAPEVLQFAEMPCVTFSLTLVNAALWNDLGGFSEEYHGENYSDTDFCLRALEKDAKICYEPRTAAVHYESATRGHNLEMNTKTFKLFQENWVYNGKLKELLINKGFM